MMEFAEITSHSNDRIKKIQHLKKKRKRDQSNQFIIEGYRELLRATDGRVEIKELYISPELFLGSNESSLITKIKDAGAEIFQLPRSLFEKLSYRDRPDGLLAIALQNPKKLEELPNTENPFFVVAESIEKPGNLGTILRSSDAVGADGVIVCDECTDVFNPNVVRASVGTLFTLPVAEASSKETLAFFKEKGIQIMAATPHAESLYTEVDLTGPVAIVLGTEQLGLSDLWMEEADLKVRIPMKGCADSLNVATATTVLLYEVLRQRMKND